MLEMEKAIQQQLAIEKCTQVPSKGTHMY